MATIAIDTFHGIQPILHPALLGDGMAIVAHNVKLKNGKLVPLRQPSAPTDVTIMLEGSLSDIADARSMHTWKKADGSIDFVLFKGVTWMSGGNLADDDHTRVIVSGDTEQIFTEDGRTEPWENAPVIYMRSRFGNKVILPLCKNALPKPVASRLGGAVVSETAITVKGYKTVADINAVVSPSKGDSYYATDSGDLNTGADAISVVANVQVVWDGAKWVFYSSSVFGNLRYTYFFWTWVDANGYESPVSPESDEITYNDGDTIKFSQMGEGEIPFAAAKVRIYKVVTGSEAGRIQFIKEFAVETMKTGDVYVTVKDEDAGEVIAVIESAPGDLRSILKVPGNYYCGFSPSAPKTVMFSDIDLPYSWPIAFRYDVEDNVVALAVTSNTVFALTDGWPFVLSGTAPESMTVAKLAGPAACVSPRGVCVYKNAVYYVSNAGLMTIYNDADAGTVCANLTEKVFSKEQWLAKNPSSCVMGQHDGALYLFFMHTDGEGEGLRIDLTEQANAVTTHDEVAKCLCVDNKTDKMYFVREGV